MNSKRCWCIFLAFLLVGAAGAAPQESDFYQITDLPVPEGTVMETSALEWMPDGKLAVGTRRGEIYLVENACGKPEAVKFQKYASGMHEILGLAWNAKDGHLYVTQRAEITKLKDGDGDGRADVFLCHYAGWAQTGDYHEYNFGSRFDAEGNLWTVLCLTGSYTSDGPWRGWCLRITPEGQALPTCSGIRSPGGIGFYQGECFYTDNQGPWNGSSSLKQLKPGSFQGHPGGNKWYADPSARQAMGNEVPQPQSKSRMVTERAKIPQLVPPVVILPHARLHNSSSGFCEDLSAGKFGPYAGQCFVADQCFSNIARCSLEKVNGVWQGAAIPFLENFKCGIIPVIQAADGSLLVGGCDRGWGSKGGKPFSLQRVVWNAKTPFEMHSIKVSSEGFVLTLTHPAEPASLQAENVRCEAWTYIYQDSYGSPEVDKITPKVTQANISPDGQTISLKLDKLTKGHVHMLELPSLRSATGEPLLHAKAYYTLNEIP